MTGCYTCGGGMGKHDPVAHSETRFTHCVLCDGTGSFPDADHPCGNCGGLGEVEYIPVVVKRREADFREPMNPRGTHALD